MALVTTTTANAPTDTAVQSSPRIAVMCCELLHTGERETER
jgi:hypothetical protein